MTQITAAYLPDYNCLLTRVDLLCVLCITTDYQITTAYLPDYADRETVGASRTVLQRPANTDQTLDPSSNRTPNDDNANEDKGMPEVMSTPQQPTTMMRFDTLEDAEKHYKMYARQKGFGVRYCFRKKSEASGELIRASLVCHRAGLKIKKKVDTQNPQPITPERWTNTTERTNCPARMFVKRRDNAWVVTEINDDHNHPLIKKWSLTGFLRSHRHIPEEEQQFVKLLHSCNLEPSRQMQLLTQLHGQREAIGYTDKDLANLLAKFRAEHKYTDMQDTIEYFKSSQQLDKDFFYKYKLDDDDKVPGEKQSLLSYSCKQTGAQEYMVDCIAKFVPGYGNKSFKIMVQLGVTTLSAAYILKRWTWLAEEMLVDMSSQVPGKVHEMPQESVILMKTTLMKNEFALLAKRNIMGQGATATTASTHTMSKSAALGASSSRSASAAAARAPAMSNSATPGVYTAGAVAGSNNQGISSHAAASGLQIQGQNASMSVMGPYAWPMVAATYAICTPVDGSDKKHHSSHVVAPEPIIRDPEKSNTKGRKRKKSF
ncbi:hypothetical protein D1007_24792 [Hordeum vulgare]|nr:hypothetical protein D1007_24792 [Hordeum vulgare]